MRLHLKIQDNSLREMKRVSALVNRQGKFILLEMNFFTIFAKALLIFLRAFPNFTVSTEGLSWIPAVLKIGVLFDVSQRLKLVTYCHRELDLRCCVGPRYASGIRGLRLWLNALEKVSVTLKEINQKIRSLSSLRFSKKHIAPHRIVR